MRGRGDTWAVIDTSGMTDDIWDIEQFDSQIYVSTLANLYLLIDDKLELVDFGEDRPVGCYKLSAAEGIFWSIGERDLMSFDGKAWTRVV
jgi:hypothetical protein